MLCLNKKVHARANYENYEIAHFRLLGDTNYLPYGKSMVEASATFLEATSTYGRCYAHS